MASVFSSRMATAIVVAFIVASASGSQVVPGFKTTYDVIKPGSGKLVTKGATVSVHATGSVLSDSGAKKFWSTKDPGQQPFTYTAGVQSVITGWDMGCLGMKLGEVRMLVIPSDEGYGATGFPSCAYAYPLLPPPPFSSPWKRGSVRASRSSALIAELSRCPPRLSRAASSQGGSRSTRRCSLRSRSSALRGAKTRSEATEYRAGSTRRAAGAACMASSRDS